jgi:acyl-CoA synthetase (NDP forming)
LSSAKTAALDALFNPRSVAIIGASAVAGKQGAAALRYLRQGGFPGAIYPVNPAGGEIDGLTCYARVSDIPGPVDCVLTVIPAAATLEALRECAAKGVRAAIIGANGFADLNTPEGHAREMELRDIARAHGMCVVGPNTNGIWNASGRLSLGYNTSHGDPMVAGPVSIVAHSGALFNSVAPCLQRFGALLSKFVPVGNEADLNMLDFFDYFIDDEATRVIGLIVEGLSDGERFRRLAARARAAGKPVVALKLGRSQAGAGSALAHSSRLAGSARAYAALFAECGVVEVSTIEALAGAAALLSVRPAPSRSGDRGLVCVSTSGGGGSLLADQAADRGIPLAGAPDGTWGGQTARVIEGFTGAGLIRNPIDGGNLAGWKRLETLLTAIEADGHDGPLVMFSHMLPQETIDLVAADILIARRARTGLPLVVVAPGGLRPAIAAHYRAHGALVFPDLGSCFDSLDAWRRERAFEAAVAPASGAPAAVAQDLRAAVAGALTPLAPGAFLPEADSARILAMVGAPMVATTVVAAPDEAVAAARKTGFPVVLKALAPGVAHKHDAGLVMLGLADEQALGAAFAQLARRVESLGAGDATIILQPMARGRAELILGSSYEEGIGHFLLLGLGGVNAELFNSTVLIPAFASDEALRALVASSVAGQLIARVVPSHSQAALDGVVNTLIALRSLLQQCGDLIGSIDVNPLLVTDKGCIAVDALIVRR